jgi:hypothetical protein
MAFMVTLVAFASFAVDMGRLQLVKSELQAATDAAAHYAATGLPSGPASVKARAAYAASANTVDGTPLVIDPTDDIEFGNWDSATNAFSVVTGAAQSSARAVRVTGRRLASRGTGVPSFFASLFGQTQWNLQVSCIAFNGSATDDVFLIQDVTLSFAEELPDAKIGDQALLDCLYQTGGGGRLAVAVHSGWGVTLAPLTRISTDYSYLSSKISSINLAGWPGMPASTGTDIASGLDEAIAAYTSGSYVAPAGGVKTVVLVSDGQPTNNAYGKHPTLTDSQLLSLAQARADTLWSNNVHVYVIFMDADNDPVAAGNLQTLVRGNGDFVRVTTPSQLPTALADITNKIGKISIVK